MKSTESAGNLSVSERLSERVNRFLVQPMDAAPVRWFECLFTLTFLLNMGRCLLDWPEWLTSEGFHLDAVESELLRYPAPQPLMSAGWQVLIYAVLIFGSGLTLLTGKKRRLALLLLWGCAVYGQQVDILSAHSLNKFHIAIYTLLLLGPGIWRDEATDRFMQSASMLRILQATLILSYLAAGLAKVDGDWLTSSDVLWSQVQGIYRTELTSWLLLVLPKAAWTIMQHLSLAFELLAPLFFIVARLRFSTMIFGLLFHGMIALLMRDLIYFSLQMACFYALFVTADEWWAFENGCFRKYRSVGNSRQGGKCGLAISSASPYPPRPCLTKNPL
jgi:hypothetical protein